MLIFRVTFADPSHLDQAKMPGLTVTDDDTAVKTLVTKTF